MSKVILYIASSLDGYIATRDGHVDWLEPYLDALDGFEEFRASLGSIVMGRKTYEFNASLSPWPFEGLSIAVLTNRAIQDPPDRVFTHRGPVVELVDMLRRESPGDIWLMGGGQAIAAFQQADLIDEYRLFQIPILLGHGIPLFPSRVCDAETLTFQNSTRFPSGVHETTLTRTLSGCKD